MKKRLFCIFLASLVFAGVSPSAFACDPTDVIGNGGCPPGEICTGPVGSATCSGSTPLPCSGTGCGASAGGSSTCGTGYACVSGGCVSDSSCTASSCTGTGCGTVVGGSSSCGTGLACISGSCVFDLGCILDDTPDESCTLEGCGDPVCGAGFSCDEGECVLNSTCVGNVIDVPYDGPRIDSLARLIGLIYNVMFPGALLIGVIMIIKGGYELMTSEGNPQLARAGQEDLTAAIMGTVFIIMSGLILRMIIIQILGGAVAF